MKTYDVYVPLQSKNGDSSWEWLEKLLSERFGNYTALTGYHVGKWQFPSVRIQGKMRTYSVDADEVHAREFFRGLKRLAKKLGQEDILILEKDAQGERI